MRSRRWPSLSLGWLVVTIIAHLSFAAAWAQEDKKTDNDKPADPDTGQSTIEETTLGIFPNPVMDRGVKFAATYIGETLGNVTGGSKQGTVYEGRLNLAVDINMERLVNARQLTFHANIFQFMATACPEATFRISWW